MSLFVYTSTFETPSLEGDRDVDDAVEGLQLLGHVGHAVPAGQACDAELNGAVECHEYSPSLVMLG